MLLRSLLIAAALSATLALSACAETFIAPERSAGDRAPLTRQCDDSDPTLCLLPWPNSAFLRVDDTTATGVRLEVDLSLVSPRDDAEILTRADGFSRVSSVVTGFDAEIDPATLTERSLRVVLAETGHPMRGTEASLSREVVVPRAGSSGEGGSSIVGHPLIPLVPGADYVVVVTDELRTIDGTPLEANHMTRVHVGLADPVSQAEADVGGYHAPTRALLTELGIDPSSVLRVWDFTTRSEEDPRARLRAMRAAALDAVETGAASVVIDEVEHFDDGAIASIVRGHLAGMPNYLVDRELSVGADGMPVVSGTHDAPFRVMIPRGTGDYRMLMFGHGTGGTVDDTSFDDTIAGLGVAKVSIEFYAWTERTVIDTFLELRQLIRGASIAAAGLMQAMADGAAIRLAMSGQIANVLAADELMGATNPNAGRRPDDSIPMWVGGSLGGTMGLLFVAMNPDIRYAVFNVPGAGWGTWVRDAYQYSLLERYIEGGNGGPLATVMMLSAAQTLLDEVDGASWAEVIEAEPIVALVQESIGDPVLPNPGTHMVARLLGATQVGAPLIPLPDLESSTSVTEASGLTQFHVPGDDPLEVHGFADRSGPAGDAAREQIDRFIASVWDGAARVEIPSGCVDMSCDFTR